MRNEFVTQEHKGLKTRISDVAIDQFLFKKKKLFLLIVNFEFQILSMFHVPH